MTKLNKTKKGTKRRQSQLDKLNCSLKSMSINESEAENLESYDEDDEIFEDQSKKEKIENNLNNLRTFSQNIPSNHCSFKDRGQKRVNITNACTIDYFLLSLWTSTQINNNFLKICEKKGGIYFDLFEII